MSPNAIQGIIALISIAAWTIAYTPRRRTEVTINIEPAERAIAFIEAHPEKHNQATWTRKTGACLGGWIALQNGYDSALINGRVTNGSVTDAHGDPHDVLDVAMKILGIETWGEAMVLFAATNDVEKLKLMTKDLANGERLEDTWLVVGVGTNAHGIYPIYERTDNA